MIKCARVPKILQAGSLTLNDTNMESLFSWATITAWNRSKAAGPCWTGLICADVTVGYTIPNLIKFITMHDYSFQKLITILMVFTCFHQLQAVRSTIQFVPRRPMLQPCSPCRWTGRAAPSRRWGAPRVQVSFGGCMFYWGKYGYLLVIKHCKSPMNGGLDRKI